MYATIVNNVSVENNVAFVGNVSTVKYMNLPIKKKNKKKFSLIRDEHLTSVNVWEIVKQRLETH